MIWLFLLLSLSSIQSVSADTTTGGVNWLDSLGYTKPQFYPITVPNEAAATKKYVDLSAGTNGSGTQASPYNSIPNTASGPTYIYVKGSGAFGAPTLTGSSGNEIVIKPWDDATQATFTGRNNWTQSVQNVIIDGGPNLRIKFNSTSGGQFDPSIYFNASGATTHSNITFYRTQWNVPGSGLWVAQWGQFTNLKFINSEFQAASSTVGNSQHHLYFSGASNYGPSTGLYILNSILRDTPGEAVEFRLFTAFSNVYIQGNAFHDTGKGTCATGSSGWHCRSAITFGYGSAGGAWNGTWNVSNNLIWDTGENCIREWENPSTLQVYGNTCYNWGSSATIDSYDGHYGAAAFSNSGWTNGNGIHINNIIYHASGSFNGYAYVPFPGSSTASKSYNACSGTPCGTTSQSISASDFLSLSENSANFLRLQSSAAAVNSADNANCIAPDYFGTATRSPCDIGAMEYIAAGDLTSPSVSMTAPAAGSTVSGSSVTVSATATDNVGVVGVQFKDGATDIGAEDTTAPYSVTWDSTGTADGTHSLTAVARDAAGNTATATAVTVTVDNTPPSISGPLPSGQLASGTTSVTLQVTTNEAATCRYSASDVAYASMTNTFASTGGTTHQQAGFTVSDGNAYTRYVRCVDAQGNANGSSAIIDFSVASPSDTSPPVLSGIGPSGMQALGTTSVNLVATTDEAATCKYAAASGVSYAAKTSMATTGGTSHSQAKATKPGGVYHYWIACRDTAGNTSADSNADFWVQTIRKRRRH